ncbi:MAG: hypothetical protein JWN39_2416 [Ilumatobacteraceae bacterium]|nr:hypothetical protein [Ilumatobacteraceae bacterium]
MPTDDAALPPRAGIALLTLQLRAALQEAEEAEADDAAIDHDAAREQLRARLDPLVEERRRALDDALAAARADAETRVAAAHRAATVMAAQAARRAGPPGAVTPRAPARQPIVDESPRLITQVVPSVAPVTEAAGPVVGPTVIPIADVPQSKPTNEVWRPADTPTPTADAPSGTTTLVIDAEAFATVFATVFASVLDERLSALGTGLQAPPPWAYGPPPVPAPVKQSFWAHARHTDVLLLSFAMIIALVVLAAWLA